jgi:hypothetical protein
VHLKKRKFKGFTAAPADPSREALA